MDSFIDFTTLGKFFLYSSAFFGAFIAALWLSLVFWTARDIQLRTRDRIVQLLSSLIVLLLNIPGLIIYLILRPKQTLDEIYQRTLEDEVLLGEIEASSTCPGCGSVIDKEWQICPHCHTRLHKECTNCGRLMELPWHICPYCAHQDPNMRRPAQGELLTLDEVLDRDKSLNS
ncbi:MAG: zinc ribbon domain-containing protein [Chloroflexi bacterium]|nr:zinc ribbon domain-containing protein [Chloroflexota bacterium]